ncbi:MAG: hypothetical protein GTO22_03590, partial [Gemmatimonadales bacterium]|nr:hypothetical protein [Gemmatimonadales bacterium]
MAVRVGRLLDTGLLLILWSLPLAAQAPQRPSFSAVRMVPDSDYVTLDGILDESVWLRAPIATGLRQQEPEEGVTATEATEVRVLCDGRTLYVGVLARDSRPDAVIARILQRDRIMEASPFEGLPQFAGDDAVA